MERIKFSVFQRSNGLLTKQLSLNAEGQLVKDSTTCALDIGQCRLISVESLEELDEALGNLTIHQAVSYGIGPTDNVTVVSKNKQEKEPEKFRNAITRTRDNFSFPNPAIMMLDYDPPADGSKLTPTGFVRIMRKAYPPLKKLKMLVRPSASSHLFNGTEEIVGLSGFHVYFFVKQGEWIPEIGKALETYLWNKGHGRIQFSRSGAALPRCLVDTAVWQPERLDFVAGGACKPPLERRPESSSFVEGTEKILSAFDPVPVSATDRFRKAVAAAKKEKEPEKQRVIEQYVESQAVKQAGKNASKEEIEQIRDSIRQAADHYSLCADFTMHLDTGETVTVAEVLANRMKYHGQTLADPLEPEHGGGRCKAKLFLDGHQPMVNSFIHGGRKFYLSLKNARIQVQKGVLSTAVDQVSELLVNRYELYRRGGGIVALLPNKELPGNPMVIHSMNQETIAYMATESIDFFTVKMVAGEPTEVPADPPRNWMDTLIKTKSWLPALKPLADITRQPVLRDDGSILDQPGYDPKTQLYYASDETFPPIPENPTFEDAKKAVKALLEPFRGYDFVSREDKSALLAVLLTAATRKSFPTAPGILITSPVAGSGKTKMAQCINILAGATEAVHNWPGNNETPERHKKLLSELINCSPGILFDNLEGELQDPTLCQILTAPLFTGRILGQTESVTVSTRAMLLFTGNNVRPAADLCRRILQIQLDPQCESPEKRKFDFDPTDVVRDNRPWLVTAALTVLRAYDVADRPETFQTAIGSYREFDLLVRGAVVWLGFNDIANCINRTQSDDPDKDMLLDLHDAWEACFEFGKVQNAQLQELIKKAKEQNQFIEEDEHRLIDTLCQLTSGSTTARTLTSRQVTTILGHRKNRIVANRRIVKVKRTSAARGGWQLEQINKPRLDEAENVPEEDSVPPHQLETVNRAETPVLGVEF